MAKVRQPLAYALALSDAGVRVDMRIDARGGHALGIRPTTDPISREWPGQVEQWLHDLGLLSKAAVLAKAAWGTRCSQPRPPEWFFVGQWAA